MTGKVDSCVRVHVLSASALPRSSGGNEASSWFVEAKIRSQDREQSEVEPYRTKPSRVGTWNEELAIPLDAGDAQSCRLQLDFMDATLREQGFKASTFKLRDFVPWNGYHLDIHVGREVRLRVSILIALEDPVVDIQHVLHLEALLLTFPEGMPLPGVLTEAGATVKSTIQCIPKGTAHDVSLQASRKCEAALQHCDAADDEAIELDVIRAGRDEGNLHLWSTLPVVIDEDQVTWDDCIDFPVGRQVKKAYMAHVRAYPRQLYGKGKERELYQVSFIVSFFVVGASSQASTALGFAVLEIPDDVRLFDGGAELSADVTSPDGEPLEDVVCVVDLKVTGPPPRSARGSDTSADDEDEESHLATDERSASRSTTSEGGPGSKSNSEDIQKQKALQNQIESLRGNMQAIRAEADQKQTVVDHLSEQVDKRSDAIRKCGAEIVKLRKHIEIVDQERCRLDSQLKTFQRSTAEAEMEVNRIMKSMEDGDSGHGPNEDARGRHTRALAKRCILLTDENRTLRKVAQDSAHERWQAAVLKSEMEKMKKTQHVQAVYIRKMQALPGKVSAYKSTVSMQEKVIAKLEMLVAGRRPPSSGNTEARRAAGDAIDATQNVGKPPRPRELGRTGDEVDILRKENATLRWRLAMAGNTKEAVSSGPNSEDVSLLMEMRDSKIRILEEQMIVNAKAAGDEIASLKMRVMELEMGVTAPAALGVRQR